VPAALDFRPQLVLISAGFDAHRLDPIGGCMLDSADFAQMACHVPRPRRDARSTGRRGTRRWLRSHCTGGHVIATLTAPSGVGEAESIAPDPILTSRAAAQFGRYWRL
jgi:Histone deacetylase domain